MVESEAVMQVQEVVEAMQERTVPRGCYVIREGETGSYLYVAAEGQFDVIKEGRVLGSLGVGKVFGELAILYNCKRTASIRAGTDGKVWALERRVFQQVMVSSGLKRISEQRNFLRSVPLLSHLPANLLTKLGDVLETEQFTEDGYIIREGTVGDTFYILAGGRVRVTKRKEAGTEEVIRYLGEGDYFGEMVNLQTFLNKLTAKRSEGFTED